MRKTIVAGNWKMNTDIQAGGLLADGVVDGIRRAGVPDDIQVVLCPPFTHLSDVVARAQGTPVKVGAQNVSRSASGAFTGEISVTMLKSVGCSYVIVGHSERRLQFAESDSEIGGKVSLILGAKLSPIICIGETETEREQGRTADIIRRQLKGAVAQVYKQAMLECVIAYEPVWAIGTGKTATPEQAEEVHGIIRDYLAQAYSSAIADEVSIIYGGSVTAATASGLFAKPNIDGALVGGASLDPASFLAIVNSAVAVRSSVATAD